jgi:hypothetical protein
MTASTEPAGTDNLQQHGSREKAPSGPQRGSPADQGSVLTAVGVSSVVLGGRVAAVTPLLDRAYRALLLVLACSVPVGILLSHLHHS